jgi:hypothetical protein
MRLALSKGCSKGARLALHQRCSSPGRLDQLFRYDPFHRLDTTLWRPSTLRLSPVSWPSYALLDRSATTAPSQRRSRYIPMVRSAPPGSIRSFVLAPSASPDSINSFGTLCSAGLASNFWVAQTLWLDLLNRSSCLICLPRNGRLSFTPWVGSPASQGRRETVAYSTISSSSTSSTSGGGIRWTCPRWAIGYGSGGFSW